MDKQPAPTLEVTRENLRDGVFDRLVADQEGLPLRPKAARDASRRAVLDDLGPGKDLWIFAYGSLIWNPAFHYADRCRGMIHGYHRSFCLRTQFARGTEERPGLMLALDRGGSCTGVAYRIGASQAEAESEVIWAREMLFEVYEPRWVRVSTAAGPVEAITFVINRAAKPYTGRLPPPEVAATIASAAGHIGSNLDYLRFLLAGLREFGIEDRALAKLHDLVDRELARLE
jgi:cation transport protein ChaC